MTVKTKVTARLGLAELFIHSSHLTFLGEIWSAHACETPGCGVVHVSDGGMKPQRYNK